MSRNSKQKLSERLVEILLERKDNVFICVCVYIYICINIDINIDMDIGIDIRSDQISHSVVSDSLQPHEWQHTRPPCPSPTLGVH